MEQNPDIRVLFRRHYRPLCLYALHYLKDADAVEDVVQDAFTAWWQKRDEVDNVRPYLFSMVRNRCIDILRRQGRQAEQLLPEDADGIISDEEAVERSETEARLWNAVNRLPARRREILLMSKRDAMSYEQIAVATGLSVYTVRNQISRALKSLREEADQLLRFLLLLPSFPVACFFLVSGWYFILCFPSY